MEQQKLAEQKNEVVIVGTLKSHDFEVKVSKKGKTYISGNAKIEVFENNQLNVLTVSVYATAGNKIYDGLVTVMNEYKTTEKEIEITKDENAKGERVRVRGSIDLEEYISNDEIKRYNKIKGVFFNRLKNPEQDSAKALIDVNISSIVPVNNTEGLPTGELKVDGFTVGYNEKIIPFLKLLVGPNLAPAFQAYYRPFTTASLSIRLQNYAVEKEQKPTMATQTAFGESYSDIGDRVAYDYVNDYLIVGGENPYMDFRNLTPEQHEKAAMKRKLAIDSLSDGYDSAAPAQDFKQGFDAAPGQAPIDVESQLPFDMPQDQGMPNF